MEDSSLTLPERKAFVAIKVLGSALSVVGSSLVIFMVLRRKKALHSQRPTYHRFLLAMSVYDLMQAAWQGLGAVPVPRWTHGYGCFGNTASCTALGFFVTLAMGGWVYNAGLSIYYIMVIRHGVSESTIAKILEPTVHVLAFVVSMGLGVSGLYLTVFNAITPSPEVGCFAWPYPDTCFYDVTTCKRGRYYGEWGWVFYAFQCFCVAIVIVMSAMLYVTIRKQYQSTSRYASGETAQMRERTKAVAWQAFLFALACFYANIWNILTIVAYSHGPHWFLMAVLYNGLFGYPAQGFFNFLIYISPRYQRFRQRKPESGRLVALYEVVFVAQEGDRRGSSASSPARRRSTVKTNALKDLETEASTYPKQSDQTLLSRLLGALWPRSASCDNITGSQLRSKRRSFVKSSDTFESQASGEEGVGPYGLEKIKHSDGDNGPVMNATSLTDAAASSDVETDDEHVTSPGFCT